MNVTVVELLVIPAIVLTIAAETLVGLPAVTAGLVYLTVYGSLYGLARHRGLDRSTTVGDLR